MIEYKGRKPRKLKTHCKYGHERTPDNISSQNACKICANEKAKQRYYKLLEDKPERILSNRETTRKWKERNKEKIKENSRNYGIKNFDRLKKEKQEEHVKNPQKRKIRAKTYAQNNPAGVLARSRKHQTAKLQRTPPWLTAQQFKEIEAFYLVSAMMAKLTGVQHNVDHIVPLQGKNVSGLHIPVNLQILTAEENISKGNKWVSAEDNMKKHNRLILYD